MELKKRYLLFYIPVFIFSFILIIYKNIYCKDYCFKEYKILVSGSSDNHFHLLLLFLYRLYSVENKMCIIIWDLGLSQFNIKRLKNAKEIIEKKRFIIIIKHFNYSNYPYHFSINKNSGYYSWKPFVIWDTYSSYKRNVLWLDCGCFIHRKLEYEYNEIINSTIYTVGSGTTIQRYTHRKLFELLNVDISIFNKTMCSAGIVGIYYPSTLVRYIFKLWKACALIKNCISPQGANRGNHRQDQSVLSILLYQYINNFTLNKNKNFAAHFDKKHKNYNDSSYSKFLYAVSQIIK